MSDKTTQKHIASHFGVQDNTKTFELIGKIRYVALSVATAMGINSRRVSQFSGAVNSRLQESSEALGAQTLATLQFKINGLYFAQQALLPIMFLAGVLGKQLYWRDHLITGLVDTIQGVQDNCFKPFGVSPGDPETIKGSIKALYSKYGVNNQIVANMEGRSIVNFKGEDLNNFKAKRYISFGQDKKNQVFSSQEFDLLYNVSSVEVADKAKFSVNGKVALNDRDESCFWADIIDFYNNILQDYYKLIFEKNSDLNMNFSEGLTQVDIFLKDLSKGLREDQELNLYGGYQWESYLYDEQSPNVINHREFLDGEQSLACKPSPLQ